MAADSHLHPLAELILLTTGVLEVTCSRRQGERTSCLEKRATAPNAGAGGDRLAHLVVVVVELGAVVRVEGDRAGGPRAGVVISEFLHLCDRPDASHGKRQSEEHNRFHRVCPM